jgi:hypothetical protein
LEANLNIPSELFAGDSATWKDAATVDRLNAVIDSAWTLKYVISFPTAVTLTATTDGSGWSTTISKTNTAVAAGDYYWQAYAELSTRRESLGSGVLKIRPAAADAVTGKSQAQTDLDTVEAAIRSLTASTGAQEYSIAGRSFKRAQLSELIVWRDRLKSIVRNEKKADRIKNGLGNPNNVFVRFK